MATCKQCMHAWQVITENERIWRRETLMARVRYVYTFSPSLDQSRLINVRYPILQDRTGNTEKLVCMHWKLKRSVSAPKCQFSPAGQSQIQPVLEPLEHNLGQKCSIKRLFQPTVGPISVLGPNQRQLIRLYWPWFKEAKLDSKLGLYFTHQNGPILRAKTDLSDLECGIPVWKLMTNLCNKCSTICWKVLVVFKSQLQNQSYLCCTS